MAKKEPGYGHNSGEAPRLDDVKNVGPHLDRVTLAVGWRRDMKPTQKLQALIICARVHHNHGKAGASYNGVIEVPYSVLAEGIGFSSVNAAKAATDHNPLLQVLPGRAGRNFAYARVTVNTEELIKTVDAREQAVKAYVDAIRNGGPAPEGLGRAIRVTRSDAQEDAEPHHEHDGVGADPHHGHDGGPVTGMMGAPSQPGATPHHGYDGNILGNQKDQRDQGTTPKGMGAMPSLSQSASEPGRSSRDKQSPPRCAAPSHQHADNSFWGWLCNYEGSQEDGLTADVIETMEALLGIAEGKSDVASLKQLWTVWRRAFQTTVDPPLYRIWEIYERHTRSAGLDDPSGLVNGALAAFNNLVPKFARLLGVYGTEETARGIMTAELVRARKRLNGAVEGRLAIAIDDMVAKYAKGNLNGDPARRLYGFMSAVDPVKADERAEAMRATRPAGVKLTPEERADDFLNTPNGERALRYQGRDELRAKLIKKYAAEDSGSIPS